MMAKCSSFILLQDLAYHNDSISKRTKSAKRGWIPRIFGIKQEVEFEEDLGGEKRRYWMWNSPMARPVSLSVGWSVSRSVFHNCDKFNFLAPFGSLAMRYNEVEFHGTIGGRISKGLVSNKRRSLMWAQEIFLSSRLLFTKNKGP